MSAVENPVVPPRWSPWVGPCTALLLAIGSGASAETLQGPGVAVQGGVARTYVILDDSAAPTEVGVALNEAFLAALPADGTAGGITMPDGHTTFEYLLPMPEGNPTPFRHVTLDWNPVGHIPLGVYDRPHLDVHFYTISNEERLSIRPDDPRFMEKARRLPAPEYIPHPYADLGTPPVPHMGLHLLDPASPELRKEAPSPFTYTLLYGSWDGRMIFIEPMVTVAFLASRPELKAPVPMAERHQPHGHYPSAYRVHWDPQSGEYRIALTDLKRR